MRTEEQRSSFPLALPHDERRAEPPSGSTQTRTTRDWRLFWTLLVLALLAVLTTLSSAAGHFIADNHFEWFWAPTTPLK